MANKHTGNRAKRHTLTEDGFASIVIALVLIVVLALMTVGFATLARREQQSALNKQLANQAYDAAESGINDAYADILHNYITASTNNNCIDPTTLPAGSQVKASSGNIDSSHGVSYTCLMVNLTPPTLTKALDPGSAWSTVFSTTGSNALSSFDVTWNSTDSQYDTPPGGTTFPPIGSATDGSQWGSAPAMLQFSITPLNAVDRTSLLNNTQTYYFRPTASGSGSVTVGSDASGSIISATCSQVAGRISTTTHTTGACGQVKVNVKGLSGSPNEYYLVHIINYYDKSQVYLTNAKDSSSNGLNFSNSQVVIDVTGKARQVLKRLQVYKPLYQPGSSASYGVEAQDICKRFSTDPVAGTVEQSSGITDPNNSCSVN
ncbi:MAG TPA: pilus assembly PilX N-terminal domain-containing protein [Candidatus Saccharimonadales bacterium]|nr:pilus assembly PilX N-terminal domain-containing protein [Candidatus Saccharimonadales bacterium]